MKDSLVIIKDRENKIKTRNYPYILFRCGLLVENCLCCLNNPDFIKTSAFFSEMNFRWEIGAQNVDTFFFQKFCWKVRERIAVQVCFSLNLTFRKKNSSIEGVVEEL